MRTMKYKIDSKADTARVSIIGALNEQCQTPLQQLVRELAGKVRHVDFDCSEIDGINSTGVAHWVTMLQDLDKGISYEFSRCSIFFIDYANLITEITNDAPIVSFFAPMKCPSCGLSESPLLLTQDVDPVRGFGVVNCSRCKVALISEVDPSDYLMFLED